MSGGDGRDTDHGPLPALLLALTLVTGLVDAVAFLALGRAFVGNMTGNVVFLGLALGGVQGFAVLPPLLSVACFAAGAVAGGRVSARFGAHRGRHIAVALAIEAALMGATLALALVAASTHLQLALLALAMGVQSATAHRLGVPDLTTTVLTQTLTGLASESVLAGGTGPNQRRRIAALAALACGAALGAGMMLWASLPFALGAALAVVAVALAWAYRASVAQAPWAAAR